MTTNYDGPMDYDTCAGLQSDFLVESADNDQGYTPVHIPTWVYQAIIRYFQRGRYGPSLVIKQTNCVMIIDNAQSPCGQFALLDDTQLAHALRDELARLAQ